MGKQPKKRYHEIVLQRIRQAYDRDTAVVLLNQRLKKVETENGQLRAELAHLEHQMSGNKELLIAFTRSLRNKGERVVPEEVIERIVDVYLQSSLKED